MDTPIVPNSTEPVWNEECSPASPHVLSLLLLIDCFFFCLRYHLKWTPGYEQHRYLNVDVMHKVRSARWQRCIEGSLVPRAGPHQTQTSRLSHY